jgi:ketosteroid isomerase-like protein
MVPIDIAAEIVALETAALERWNRGDPGGYLELSADDVVYFDPFTEQRVDGIEALSQHYAPIKGQVRVSRYEMISPRVHATRDMAVLTFNLNSYEGDKVYRWNCTEAYRHDKEGNWKLVQTHWSFVKPSLPL